MSATEPTVGTDDLDGRADRPGVRNDVRGAESTLSSSA